MRPRTWRTIRAALFEASFVVLGIVLALAANDWYENRVLQRRADAALSEVVLELGANRDAVEASLTYHTAVLDSLSAYRRTGTTPHPYIFTQGFIFPAQLSRTAWESASETGSLVHMDYGTVLSLSRIYAQEARYETQARSIGQIIYNALYDGGPEGVVSRAGNLATLIGAFAYRERQLRELYDEVLPGLPDVERTR